MKTIVSDGTTRLHDRLAGLSQGVTGGGGLAGGGALRFSDVLRTPPAERAEVRSSSDSAPPAEGGPGDSPSRVETRDAQPQGKPERPAAEGPLLDPWTVGALRAGFDPAPMRVAPLPPSAAGNLQDLAQHLLRRVEVYQLGSATGVRMRVEAAAMAPVGVDLRMEGGRLRASLAVSDAADLRALQSAAPLLESALEARGVSLAALTVQLDPSRHDGAADRNPGGAPWPDEGESTASGGVPRRAAKSGRRAVRTSDGGGFVT